MTPRPQELHAKAHHAHSDQTRITSLGGLGALKCSVALAIQLSDPSSHKRASSSAAGLRVLEGLL